MHHADAVPVMAQKIKVANSDYSYQVSRTDRLPYIKFITKGYHSCVFSEFTACYCVSKIFTPFVKLNDVVFFFYLSNLPLFLRLMFPLLYW